MGRQTRPNSLCDRSFTASEVSTVSKTGLCRVRLDLDSATLHTFTTHPEAASKLLRHLFRSKEMLKVYTTSCGVSNVDAAAGR